MPLQLRIARAAALGGYFALLSLLLLWHTWLAPSSYFPVSLVLLVTVLPLLAPLRGVLHGRARAHVWLAYLSLPFFIHGTVEAYANPAERWLSLLEALFSVTVFLASVLFARWLSTDAAANRS